MATFDTVRGIVAKPENVALIQAGIVKVALQIISEDPTTPNHANRVNLARSVLQASESHARQMIWDVALVSTGTTDDALTTAILATWNQYAGLEAEI